MKCNVCGWPEGPCQKKKRESSFFFIYLRKRFHESMIIPCFMREQINKMLGKIMLVSTHEGNEYVFSLKKEFRKTRIHGDGYKDFLSYYGLKMGDRIRFKLDEPGPFFKIFPEELGRDDEPVEVVKEAHVFKESAKAVVFSGGLELTASQTSKMNDCVLTRGLGLGAVYVHSLTKSDVKLNGLRIPKDIVSAIKISSTGYGILTTEFGNNTHTKLADYYTSTDGRVFLKKGWFEFARDNGFKSGDIMLIMFDKDNQDCLIISFDVL